MKEAQTISKDIRIRVELDGKHIPEQILWTAQDAGPQDHEAKAMMLAFWDGESRNGVRIDLWTKEMTVEEMNLFVCQSLLALSDTLQRATQDARSSAKLAELARQFIVYMQQGQ